MNLSLKQVAIFGQVKVDMLPPGSSLTKYITLLELYQDGWWVTDRFGSIITIVKPRNPLKYGFKCLCRQISTTINLDTLDLLTKPIAEAKYNRYKLYLQRNKPYEKIKETKNEEDDYLPVLPTPNTRRTYNILSKTQEKNTKKIPGKQKKSCVYSQKKKDSP